MILWTISTRKIDTRYIFLLASLASTLVQRAFIVRTDSGTAVTLESTR